MMREDPFRQGPAPESEDPETREAEFPPVDEQGWPKSGATESASEEPGGPVELDEEPDESASEDMYRRLWGGTRPATPRRRGGIRAEDEDEGSDQGTNLAVTRDLDRRISALRRELSEVRREHDEVMDELRSVVSLVAEYLEALGQSKEAAGEPDPATDRPGSD
jgi:hypothetical protein